VYESGLEQEVTMNPRKHLLATDLSARSDRALDRAAMLARNGNSRLVALHVIDPAEERAQRKQSLQEASDYARQLLRRDIRATGETGEVRVERGEPADVIVQVAQGEGCSLIVTGVARNEALGRFTLGATVDQLLRTSEIPLLIVTERAHTPYQRVAVAIDFTETSVRALQLAVDWWPTQRLIVFHAHDAPGSYAVSDLESHREEFGRIARADAERYLVASGLSPEARARLDVRIESGEPGLGVRNLVEQEAVDLVVLGTRGPGPISEFFLGSVAKRIAMGLMCDALVVRG
jgi:nucleotide-binding universal stress UspA family protein